MKKILKNLLIALVIILIVAGIVFGLVFSGLIPQAGNNEGNQDYDTKTEVKKVILTVNQILASEKQYAGKVNYDDVNGFSTMIVKRMSPEDVRYLEVTPYKIKVQKDGNEVEKTVKFPLKEYSAKEIKEYNLSEYKGKPIITMDNGVMYMFYKFKKGCKTVDLDKPANSDCLIDIDISGTEKPNNKKNFNIKKPYHTDRYTFILNGNSDKIVPARVYHVLISNKKETQNDKK